MTKIAILGWGSLLWDKTHRKFDRHHGAWKFDGPVLKLEFSRKSASRLNALTLVIDTIHGEECKVAYALSKRRTVEKALEDLQEREGTSQRNIG
jgi:cation transport regulator ChaC